jgi:hypothetical protein
MSTWQPYSRFVQADLYDGKFLNASFTLLAAGPPRLAQVGGATYTSVGTFGGSNLEGGAQDDFVYPIGVVQNFSLSHNRQFSRIFEIGSERSFFISGHTMGQLGLGRIMYHGPSLLKVMYAYYEDKVPPTVYPLMGRGLATFNPHDTKIPPGYQNLFLNLASDLFSQPMGLLVYFKDSNEWTVGAVYLEACFIPSHQITADAQGTIIQESVGVQFERLMPVAVQVPQANQQQTLQEANQLIGVLDQ